MKVHVDPIDYDIVIPVTKDYHYYPKGLKETLTKKLRYDFVVKPFMRHVNHSFLETEVVGRENLRGIKKAMVTCNHVQMFDCIALKKAMNVGENIRKCREEAGLTQKGLADQLFVTPQAISRWEKGEVEPSLDALRSMSEIFNVSVEVLINGQPAGSLPSNAGVKEEQKNETPQASAAVVATPNQLLGVCVRCGRAIYENEEHSHGAQFNF